MKERPILFQGAMVRALLDGSKTQTRRVVKQRDLEWLDIHQGLREPDNKIRCPYGQPGDRLWVRETWLKTNPWSEGGPHTYGYRASDEAEFPDAVWKPSIHMPRLASRITLEVTDVRLERLQDITEADAKAEGCAPAWLDAYDHTTVHAHAQPTYKRGYARLWGEINGDASWDANPWVWVLSFTVAQP